jgi:hypothetical protein
MGQYLHMRCAVRTDRTNAHPLELPRISLPFQFAVLSLQSVPVRSARKPVDLFGRRVS